MSKAKTRKRKLISVIERDGQVCWLCGLPVEDLSLHPSVDPAAPSLDHVIPRSKGGTGHIENLRLSHRACNNARGNHLTRYDAEDIAVTTFTRRRRSWTRWRRYRSA